MTQFARDVLQELSEALEVPPSHYERATERYHALGQWLARPESSIHKDRPRIYPQGSFRLGLAVRPLRAGEYDLDLVCELEKRNKDQGAQEHLKDDVGREIVAYADVHSMSEPEPTNRCWRLDYKDTDFKFHMDILPCLPEDLDIKEALESRLQDKAALAEFAIALTDLRDPDFKAITKKWPVGNPKGYALWFEDRMRPAAADRIRHILESGIRAKAEEVPTWEWKTPLQLVVQILKRHRDVMFENAPERKPISIIIATLAAHAYGGQLDLLDAMDAIVDGMSKFILPTRPHLPNPAHPGDDLADKWTRAPQLMLARAFHEWMEQLRFDLARLKKELLMSDLKVLLRRSFKLALPDERLQALCSSVAVATAPVVAKKMQSMPRPWGHARTR